jgi:hypothetical protein
MNSPLLTVFEEGNLSLDQPVADVLPEFRSLRVAIDIEKNMDSRPAIKGSAIAYFSVLHFSLAEGDDHNLHF